MNASEARRTRHLVIRLDRGEELPAALLKALDEAEVRAGWIEGFGAVESAQLVIFDQEARAYGEPRRVGPAEIASLGGNIAWFDGATSLRLTATLARETDAGLTVLAGQLRSARAYEIELHVTAFDDLGLLRTADERTGQAVIGPRAGSGTIDTSRIAGPAPAMHVPGAAPSAPTVPSMEATALPPKLGKPKEEMEVYPETGDGVTHFAFGECTVISSDGDRIRLRQERDGRVREVSLTMLRIEEPTQLADDKRHFVLSRKN